MIRYSNELVRKAIHISSAAIPVALYFTPLEISRLVLPWATLVTLAVEMLRLHVPQFRAVFYFAFGRLLREHERFDLLGSTYLLIAALLCIYAFEKDVAVLALSFVIAGDAVAALVGRRFGRIKILDKSLEGSLACFAACLAIARLYPSPEIGWTVSLAGALTATLFELLPIPLDDNVRMSISAGFAMTLIT